MPQLFLNNFQTQFIASVKAMPDSASPALELDYGVLRVSDGAAGLLLNPGAGNWYVLTAFKRSGSAESDYEVLRVTAVDNAVVGECRLTVARGQEGTTPKSYVAGDIVELRLTAGGMDQYVQTTDGRLSNARAPTGAAGGVLSGTYPNPGFAQAMATAADLSGKVDKVTGKGLSTNDYTNADLARLTGVAEQATKNSTDAQLRDRASHTGVQPIDTVTGLQGALDAKTPSAHVGSGGTAHSNATTAAAGFMAAADKAKLDSVAASATANSTDEALRDRSSHTGTQAVSTITGLQDALNGKQQNLVSAENIKTVNGVSLLGSGDVVVTAGVDAVRRPANTSPAQSAADVTETPALAGSAYLSLYGLAMVAAQFQVSTAADFATTVVSTGDIAGAGTSYTVAAGVLSVSTVYFWRVRYKDAEGVYSDWSAPTSFTTAANFNAYIVTPTATPAAFGDPLEGGFYTGMIWNELVQSASSMTIGTGAKTFTVPSMSSAPIVYAGQQLEVRSRANPANKMVGTVTGATGTALTLNITSVGGGGTFADWSIMSRYRVIVAPKASGENASIAYKNANTAAPAATGTLTEGRKATLAMVGADTSTVYPAAHWCNNLSIGGRTDWYLPARDELELCWRNLKPATDANYTTVNRPAAATPDYQNLGSFGGAEATHGLNKNSAPAGAAYTSGAPAQTAAAAFRAGGAEAYEFGSAYYWSSSEYSASTAWSQLWLSSLPGTQSNFSKASAYRVRAVRRSII